MVLQGVQSSVGGYDLLSGCRMGRAEVRTPAIHMVFSRDGSLLVVATQVCSSRESAVLPSPKPCQVQLIAMLLISTAVMC